MSETPLASNRFAWSCALIGLGLFNFAIVGLSGPGRIDSLVGQTQVEVGTSLVEHGDSVFRDDRTWWKTSHGRDGKAYSDSGSLQSIVAAMAILVADATGSDSEGRRNFFFMLSGAVASGLLSAIYAIWFRRIGCPPLQAVLWGAAGIFCTPMWYYGASSYDQYLGSAFVVAALVVAAMKEKNTLSATLSGLLLGLACNCESVLAIFAAPAIAFQYDPTATRVRQFARMAMIVASLLIGVLAQRAFDDYKFPLENAVERAEQRSLLYGAPFANHQGAAFVALMAGFGAGALWYCPALLLGLRGLAARWKVEKFLAVAMSFSAFGFLAYVCSLSDFKGEPSWGPRLLTPLFAILWLFAWQGAAKLPQTLVTTLLTSGALVQILGLSIDPNRLFVERSVSTSFAQKEPLRYFDLAMSHLVNRPREIAESIQAAEVAPEYSPAPAPTFAFPSLDALDPDAQLPAEWENARFNQRLESRGPEVVERYRVLSSFRPWWWSMTALPADEKPVNLGKWAAGLLGCAGLGLCILGLSTNALMIRPMNIPQTGLANSTYN